MIPAAVKKISRLAFKTLQTPNTFASVMEQIGWLIIFFVSVLVFGILTGVVIFIPIGWGTVKLGDVVFGLNNYPTVTGESSAALGVATVLAVTVLGFCIYAPFIFFRRACATYREELAEIEVKRDT